MRFCGATRQPKLRRSPTALDEKHAPLHRLRHLLTAAAVAYYRLPDTAGFASR